MYKRFAIRKVITAAKSEVAPVSQYALLPGAEMERSDEIGQARSLFLGILQVSPT